jgi:homoserine kinase type II
MQDSSIADVLRRFGVADAALTRIAAGRDNEHWRIEATDGSFVLRRYNIGHTALSTAYEHEVLRQLDPTPWPVAAPIVAHDGETLVEHRARLYALFPVLRGGAGPAHSLSHLHVKGRLLARLHGDLAHLPVEGQRQGYGRIWELDAAERTFNDLLRDFGEHQSELASAIRGERYRNLRELSQLGYGEIEDQIIHGDFQRDNLLFDGAQLSGVLDFDHAHRDAAVVDVAWSIISDCAEPPEDTAISVEAAAAFVAGYNEERRLDEHESRLIVPLLRAHNLSILSWMLPIWLERRDDDSLFRIERRVRRRLPQLAERATALETAFFPTGQN